MAVSHNNFPGGYPFIDNDAFAALISQYHLAQLNRLIRLDDKDIGPLLVNFHGLLGHQLCCLL